MNKLIFQEVQEKYGEAPNSLLNYGYAVLRAMVARNLMNAGLLPTIGIFHRNRYNAFPLADDMMEPYRPYVDRKVKELFETGLFQICRKTKEALINLFYSDIPVKALMMSSATLAGVYEGTGKLLVFPIIE